MDKIQKFLLGRKLKERSILLEILEDVRALRLDRYDVKPLKGYSGLFRLRKGKIRLIFAKGEHKGILINIGFRKDIYKSV